MKQRGRKPKCPYCGGTRTIRKGVRSTVTLGDRALCVCRTCSRKFTLKRQAASRAPFRLFSAAGPEPAVYQAPDDEPEAPRSIEPPARSTEFSRSRSADGKLNLNPEATDF